MIPVLSIVGATASGKTAFAVKAASLLGGEVISADSMQIYKYMNIGTAKVTKDEMGAIPHHLIDVLEPTDDCSVSRFVDLATAAADDIYNRGKLPVICGGTGLYIDSLLKGSAFEDDSRDEKYRNELYALADEKGNAYIYDMLASCDPAAAEAIHPNNVKRVVRALEFFRTAGKSITVQKKNTVNSKYKAFTIGMNRERSELYERIDRRVDKMVEQGLFGEVKALLDMGCTEKCNSMQAIGYREAIWYFRGRCTEEEAVRLIKRNSRHYAKRQLTWFNANDEIRWINPENEIEAESALAEASRELKI